MQVICNIGILHDSYTTRYPCLLSICHSMYNALQENSLDSTCSKQWSKPNNVYFMLKGLAVSIVNPYTSLPKKLLSTSFLQKSSCNTDTCPFTCKHFKTASVANLTSKIAFAMQNPKVNSARCWCLSNSFSKQPCHE